MLSASALRYNQDLLQQLSSNTSTSSRNANRRREIRAILKAHHYATTYPEFQPLSHRSFFINRTTSDSILSELIHAATTSSEFILDTESDRVYQQPNEPSLIQLQIVLPNNFSFAIIVELLFLPSADHRNFHLIQELFRFVFSLNKLIYIWGNSDELRPFTRFNLFTVDQLNNLQVINLQFEFKQFWTQHHPHHSSSSSSCLCENCLGKLPSQLWSLQDAIAYALNEYFSKSSRTHSFGIGLDPALFRFSQSELNHRSSLTRYALNDCLSMHRIIIHMLNFQYTFPFTTSTTSDILELHPSSPIDTLLLSPSSPSPQIEFVLNDSQSVSSSSNVVPTSSSFVHLQSCLSSNERRIIHNRSCTIRQRARLNTFSISTYDIDLRFRIREIKSILSSNNIPFSAVNAPISRSTGVRTLHVGFSTDTDLHLYYSRLQSLFTTRHYDSIHYHRYKHIRHSQ